MSDDLDLTRLLPRWRAGDREALDRVLAVLYGQLDRPAHRWLSNERVHTVLEVLPDPVSSLQGPGL